jgi:hypothetical protein
MQFSKKFNIKKLRKAGFKFILRSANKKDMNR